MELKHKTICFDFDGVISKYDGWKGFDILGGPIVETINVMKRLREEGFHIIIFTTRPFTPTIAKFLKDNNVPYDAVNSNAHNPPHTSQKPIYHVMVDDRAVRYEGQSSEELYQEIKKVVERKL